MDFRPQLFVYLLDKLILFLRWFIPRLEFRFIDFILGSKNSIHYSNYRHTSFFYLISNVKSLQKHVYEIYTIFSPINGHSKRWTPLIRGQFFFHRPNSGQSLIKHLLKGRYVISGHSIWRTLLSARNSKFGLFFLSNQRTVQNF